MTNPPKCPGCGEPFRQANAGATGPPVYEACNCGKTSTFLQAMAINGAEPLNDLPDWMVAPPAPFYGEEEFQAREDWKRRN